MQPGIKEIIVGLSAHGAHRSDMKFIRRAVGAFAQQLRDKEGSLDLFEGMSSVEEALNGLLASHASPEDTLAGKSSTFDACDLRHYLAVAERAGVDFVPAREILTLESDEVSSLMAPIRPPAKLMAAIRRRAKNVFGDLIEDPLDPEPSIDREAVIEKIYAAGDMIPPGHVVRSAICGPNTMKALAGTGTLSHSDDSAKMGDVEVGCGWIREGNRTRIDVTDSRIVNLQAKGHEDMFRFLVRPWIDAARRNEGRDPHLAGTKLDGVRSWPAEWRVFIENGEVIGVGNYYGWAGEASPEAARGALAARDAARKMIEVMKDAQITPVFSDLFLMNFTMARSGEQAAPEDLARALSIIERFPMDGINCTLDFIETGEGQVTLLEGGPPHTPIGGAHPTAFCGCLALPDNPMFTDISGVAFKVADHVNMPDPSTWKLGPPYHAMCFEDVEALANQEPCPALG